MQSLLQTVEEEPKTEKKNLTVDQGGTNVGY